MARGPSANCVERKAASVCTENHLVTLSSETLTSFSARKRLSRRYFALSNLDQKPKPKKYFVAFERGWMPGPFYASSAMVIFFFSSTWSLRRDSATSFHICHRYRRICGPRIILTSAPSDTRAHPLEIPRQHSPPIAKRRDTKGSVPQAVSWRHNCRALNSNIMPSRWTNVFSR